ncbi:methylated-DNA--[protein]-cysteine S-methyltransferase [Mesorhizobium sp. BAC0120]|uniref:methylated-DNA--[protein]-cysteine S-methyltransferase n=1 Tax=Mesorhizobium sp. BAC0120 TaxID=3090670 RepID=UPI00298C34A8|nr:methylated-DNA--[protein]-cysteine S-methyltransferase [Mesorhizobium sp. BAC0120]MDW6022388.1 methylated-DNA--[protein]-cysteine S-methyltransferase [Mesorhizobium sp. BAC0120]
MTTPIAYTIADTTIGLIGVAWSDHGICRVALPERDQTRMESRFASRLGVGRGEPPPQVATAIELIKRYAEGEPVDFTSVVVDLDGIDLFRRAIYKAARNLGFGETTTYGGLADAAGHPGKARETGEALGRNPVPLIVPCHRIHAAGGKIGGFSAPGGSSTKEKLLELEGVSLGPPPPAQQAFAF